MESDTLKERAHELDRLIASWADGKMTNTEVTSLLCMQLAIIAAGAPDNEVRTLFYAAVVEQTARFVAAAERARAGVDNPLTGLLGEIKARGQA